MDSRSINDLGPKMKVMAERILICTHMKGVEILIYSTLRSPESQAKLYCQSRSQQEVERKIRELSDFDLPGAAQILYEAIPFCKTGEWMTNAAPWESWHQYGLAFDAVPFIGGKPVWNFNRNKKAWNVYGNCVKEAGITWGGNWFFRRDYPHAQFHGINQPFIFFKKEQLSALGAS